jgi:hypothetical protein
LGLSVAVEGTVKILFGEATEGSKAFKDAVKNLKKYATAWPGIKGSSEAELILARLPGLLDQLNTVRPKDVLFRLATDKAVDKSHVAAWSKLRNSAAHAADIGSSKYQKLLDRISASTVLLYQMIFYAIGYQGPFTDWSAYGHPARDYPSRDELPTDYTPQAEGLITSKRLPSTR